MKKENLVPINASTFYEGMYIQGEIYFNYNKSFILLCRDVTLTPSLLTKFHQTEWANQQLYVDKQYVDEIRVLSEQFKKLNAEQPKLTADEADVAEYMMDLTVKLNVHKDYTDIRNRLISVLEITEKEKRIPTELTEALTNDINTQIELTDHSLLIQCINNLRPPDDYLYAHATNVGVLNGMIGTWLKIPAEDMNALIQTGLYHDIGKLRVPAEIINKPSSLSKEEFEIIKKHPIYSYEILKLSGETNNLILEGILSHHERMNGTGYPSQLKVNQLSIFSRITAVSDVYDAMVAQRPYKDRHSPFDILAEFALNKFSNLDISIVNIFLERMPQALIGKRVLLSDGNTAEVVYINPQNFSYPIVNVDGKLISTNPSLRCVAMDNFLTVVE